MADAESGEAPSAARTRAPQRVGKTDKHSGGEQP
jgi:hypothetical protein